MLKTGLLALPLLLLLPGVAAAQDVPGIEICTVEKTMERRTSCLQSNVDFLKKAMTRDGLEQQKKLDAARGETAALRGQVEALKSAVTALQAGLEQVRAQITAQAAEKKPKDAPAK